jgi:hypothetical protein
MTSANMAPTRQMCYYMTGAEGQAGFLVRSHREKLSSAS